MAITISYKQISLKEQNALLLLLLLLGGIALYQYKNHKPFNHNTNMSSLFLLKEGYDARTGKWVNKKPSLNSFSISPQEYDMVKNWYATDSGNNNPNLLPVTAP